MYQTERACVNAHLSRNLFESPDTCKTIHHRVTVFRIAFVRERRFLLRHPPKLVARRAPDSAFPRCSRKHATLASPRAVRTPAPPLAFPPTSLPSPDQSQRPRPDPGSRSSLLPRPPSAP